MINPETVSSVIKKSIELISGQTTLIQSISGIADVTSPNGNNTTELHSATGDRIFFKRTRPGSPPFTAVINGPHAWTIDSETGEPEPLNDQFAAFVIGHDFLMLPFVLSHRFHNHALAGETTFQEIPCQKITAVNNQATPCDLYFAEHNGRFLGLTIHNDNTVHIHYAEWQPCQDILLPALIVITDSGGEYRFQFNQVSLNTVDESIFNMPET